MNSMDKIKELCYQLELIGIKPSILIVGTTVMKEIMDYTKHSMRSAFVWNKITVDGHTLDILAVPDENICEVYGKEKLW